MADAMTRSQGTMVCPPLDDTNLHLGGFKELSRGGDRAARLFHDFKSEMEGGQVLAGMIVCIGQLRDRIVIGSAFGAFVDARIEINKMPAGIAGGLEEYLDIALAVKATGVADVTVVVHHMIDVGRLGPSDAFKVSGKRRSDGSSRHVERERLGDHQEGANDVARVRRKEKRVRPAEVIRYRETELHFSGTIRSGARNRSRRLLPTSAADAVAGERHPFQLVALVRRHSRRAHRYFIADGGECRL